MDVLDDRDVHAVTAHPMRYSAATLRAEAGAGLVDLQRYMGWRSLGVALDYILRTPRHVLQRTSRTAYEATWIGGTGRVPPS